jgi:hypothetical protein
MTVANRNSHRDQSSQSEIPLRKMFLLHAFEDPDSIAFQHRGYDHKSGKLLDCRMSSDERVERRPRNSILVLELILGSFWSICPTCPLAFPASCSSTLSKNRLEYPYQELYPVELTYAG